MTYVNPKRLIPGSQLTTSVVGYYSAPSNQSAIVRKLSLTNTGTATVLVDIYLVPTGGSATDAYHVIQSLGIAPGQTIEPTACNQVIDPGGSIQAKASVATAVTIMASGIEYVP